MPQRAESRKDIFGAENRPFPRQTDEIKRLRCETLTSVSPLLYDDISSAEFFDPTAYWLAIGYSQCRRILMPAARHQ